MPGGAERCRVLTSNDVPPGIATAAEKAGVAAMKSRHHQLAQWLSEQADQSAMSILQTDAELTPWTQRCLHQADLVVILARAGSDPTPGPIEQALGQLSHPDALPRVDLVLLHDAPPPYRRTGAWLQRRKITRHYHVRLDSTEDRMRAGRLLTGSDLSLVLGGGGARGLGHIGVYRACQDVGLTIDRVVGVSLGSVIAGLIAQGLDWKEVAAAMRRSTVESGRLTHFTFPAISIDTGRRYFEQLDRLFGDTQIEDLPINYFCVTCSLSRARVLVHRTGGLAKWIGASSSVPGIAPPTVEAGELIVDGGVLNNLPIDLVRADGAGRVLAVDVSPEVDLLMPSSYFGRPGAFEILWAWLRSRLGMADAAAVKYPSIISLLFRASILSSIPATEALRKHADLLIELPLSAFKFFDWPKIADIIEVGRREAMEKLPAFVSLTKAPKGAPAQSR
jgi:NTE family protein